jgi:hypothetical protein
LAKLVFVTLVLAIAALTGVPGSVAGGAALEDKDRQMIDAWLNKMLEGAAVKPRKVVPIEDENVRKVFPGGRFYDISFATWPVAPRLPKQLSHEMLARVLDRDSVETIRDEETLRTFLAQALTDIRGEDAATAAALATLRLAQAVATAGSYAFDKPHVSVVRRGDDIIATARAAAQEPARGEVEIRLEFSADGKVKPDGIKIDDRSRRGPPGGP